MQRGGTTPRSAGRTSRVELMQDYVSAQTYALRSAGNSRFGYAWSPKNLAADPDAGLQRADRRGARPARRGDRRLQRHAGGCVRRDLVRRRASTALGDGRVAHVRDVEAVTDRVHLPRADGSPGAPSAPLTVELQTSAGTAYAAGVPVTVELSSSSPTAELSTGPGGPWSSTLALPIASGASSATLLRPRRRPSAQPRSRPPLPARHRPPRRSRLRRRRPVLRFRRLPPAAARPRPTSSSRRARHRRAGRRRHDHLRRRRPEPRRAGRARVPRRPAPVAGRASPAARPIAGRAARVRRRSAATSTSSRATSSRPSGSTPSSASRGRSP